jgi:hypothetical protein
MKECKITLTLAELAASKDAWQKLLAADLPIKAAYWVGKKYRKVESELADYEKRHNELVQEHGQPIEGKPGMVQVTAENMEAFMRQSAELRAIEIALDFEPIKLADIEQAKLTGRDFLLLEKFVEE